MDKHLRRGAAVCAVLLGTPLMAHTDGYAPSICEIRITLPADAQGPLDGRLLVMLSLDPSAEPRFQIRDGAQTQQVFGMDVEGWEPGETITFDREALGYPVASFDEIAPGAYTVQALLNVYETFELSTGHTVKLPPDRGEGQNWRTKPGNRYSTPAEVRLASGGTVSLTLDNVNPPMEVPEDTAYVRRFRMKSELLSAFWGRDVELGATVLLPAGFDEHPEARYPVVINHGHFGENSFDEFRTEPPEENLEPEYSERFDLEGYNIVQQRQAYQNYLDWTAPDFPRFVVLKIEHPTPYYDDSYGVNSASQGPWGDAIMRELLPEVEKRYRCIGQGWARFTYGGSTGGWIALAAQVFYPDDFNGCFAACPDPVDFRAYTIVNIYEHDNAYFDAGPWASVPRPGSRSGIGEVTSTMAQSNLRELVLGTHSRSGDQWDIWEATFSPQGPDGYPARVWDKRTGDIDPEVAAYWRERYDLSHIIERDWATLGPKLAGKIHVYAGTMDNYYLNNAVKLLEERMSGLSDPPPDAFFDYGCGDEHCWNGDHDRPNAISRLRYHQMYVDRMLERMEAAAPEGADLTSWRYGFERE